MNPITKLRFRKNPPADVPPDGFVDLVWDPQTGGFVARSSDKSKASLGGASGISDIPGLTEALAAKETPAGAAAQIAAERTATATLTNKTLTNPTINNYTEGVVAIGNSSTAKTIALTNGTFQTVTLTGNCTFTMPTATAGKSFILKVLTGAGGFTGTFTGVKWPENTAPVITTTAGRYDLISFIADGTAWSGSAIQNFTP